MSVVAMLQGTVETDLATIRTALSLARRMNVQCEHYAPCQTRTLL